MRRNDYRLIAAAIRAGWSDIQSRIDRDPGRVIPPQEVANQIAMRIRLVLAESAIRFDPARFQAACELPPWNGPDPIDPKTGD